MKKVLVTGADGFIGSHLVEGLLNDGFEVRAFCFYNSFNSYGWLEHYKQNKHKSLEFYLGDIRDTQSVQKAMKDCDTVIHLGALVSIPYSYKHPDSFIQTNINGTFNILQAALDNKVNHVVIASTSEVYGTATQIPISEKHPIYPQSPYAASKVAADALALSFFKSYGLRISIARPFNTFGPRQSTRAIIPTIITQLLNGEEKIRLGNLSPTRDFLYVGDTVRGLISIALDSALAGEAFNLCSGNEISIGELSKILIRKINPKAEIIEDKVRLRPKESEVYRLIGDASKIKEKTKWRPEFSFENGIEETIKWFSIPENLKLYTTTSYTI